MSLPSVEVGFSDAEISFESENLDLSNEYLPIRDVLNKRVRLTPLDVNTQRNYFLQLNNKKFKAVEDVSYGCSDCSSMKVSDNDSNGGSSDLEAEENFVENDGIREDRCLEEIRAHQQKRVNSTLAAAKKEGFENIVLIIDSLNATRALQGCEGQLQWENAGWLKILKCSMLSFSFCKCLYLPRSHLGFAHALAATDFFLSTSDFHCSFDVNIVECCWFLDSVKSNWGTLLAQTTRFICNYFNFI